MRKLLFALPCLMLLSSIGFSQHNNSNTMKYNADLYEKEWTSIQAFENQGLPKSALTEVEKLLAKAQAENNPAQVVKCILKKEEYQVQIEEKSNINVFYRLKKYIAEAQSPVKEVLISATARLLEQFYNDNQWEINQRTNVVGVENDSIDTWAAAKYISTINEMYLASLENTSLLQSIDIEYFKGILIGGDNESTLLRPTLYDLLAHRALDHFMNDQSNLVEPAYKFEMNDNALLDKELNVSKILIKDKTSYKYQALLLFEKLEQFHRKDTDLTPYLDVLQKRLSYVYQHLRTPEKDNAYLNILNSTTRTYANHPMWSDFKYLEAQYYEQKAASFDNNNPNDERRLFYAKALTLCNEAIAKYPNSRGAIDCTTLKNGITRKSFSFSIERVNIPDQPALALIEYKNIELLNAKLLKINAKERIEIEEIKANGYRDGSDPNVRMLNYLNGLATLRKWTIALPQANDYREHSTETIIEKPLPTGEYIILLAENEQFEGANTQYAYFAFSNISYLVRDNKGEKQVLVMHRETGEPMKGVVAEIFTQEYSHAQNRYIKKKVGNALSDNNGFMYPKVNEGQSFELRFSKGKDTLFSAESYYQYRDRSVENEYNQTIFFLDRAIYRPGQTVYFKGLALHFDKKRVPTILKNQEVRIAFFDANHQEINHLELKTNEYGTFNGEFKAPMSGLTGNMHITSSIGGNGQYFRVEEYKRPKFETVFKPIEGSYKLNDEITVTGHAKAFAGSNIDGAKVRYRVVRNVAYPYWGYRCWWLPIPQNEGMEIINGETMTNANGEFQVKFKAIPDQAADFQNQPQFNYEIKADVVDINGETHSAATNISVGTVAINVSIAVKNQNDIRNFKKFEIISTNLSGQKEPINGTLKIALLTSPTTLYKARKWNLPDMTSINEAEFRKAFPNLPYKNEDKVQNWAIKRELFNGNVDNAKTNDFDLSKMAWESGNYVAILNTKDKFGTPIEVKEYFTVYDLKSKVVPANTPYFSVVEKETYEPNDTAKVFIGTAGDKLKVLVELERNGKIETTKWLAIKNLHNVNFKVLETDRGDIHCHLTFVKNNRFYRETHTINVPWSNKDLNIEYQTFRDKLQPGAQEEWRIKIAGPKKDKVAAEMVAAMYDASLDQFAKNAWHFNVFPKSYSSIGFNPNWSFENEIAHILAYQREGFNISAPKNYWQLIEPNIYFGGPRVLFDMAVPAMAIESGGAMPKIKGRRKEGSVYMVDGVRVQNSDPLPPAAEITKKEDLDNDEDSEIVAKPKETTVQPRTNLKETVFFMPNLMTDADGNIIIKFTMNEALTRWKFLGFAHSQDLKFALTEKEVVTQKDLMVLPNAPRFMREGDTFEFTSKVTNLTEKTLNGTAILELFDAVTNQPVNVEMSNNVQNQAFSANAGQSARVAWLLKIPLGKINALTWRVTAKADNFSDGEESSLPILTNRMLVTETKPLPVRANKTKAFTFEAMDKALKSNTLQTHKLTLEFTSNPAWYAVQALPYIMEYPYECTEQLFSRFYANSLATSVTNAHPKIKNIFEKWKSQQPNALLSNLNKNQELKYAILEETPWVMQACNEAQQKQNIALLFDLNRMSDEANRAIDKLAERQMPSGGFSWFPEGRESWYITQYLIEGMGHLKKMNVKIDNNQKINTLIQKALPYIDREFVENYNRLKVNIERGYGKWEDDNLDGMALHYLYARSFFPENQMSAEVKKAADYYLGQAEKYWTKRGIFEQGLIILALERNKKSETTTKIIKSLKERALNNDEMGMYWKQEYGYYWNELPIETHALMIEVFKDVAKDETAVDDLKTWLLKNKQTNHWKTTKATASAVYVLLMSGNDWLLESKDVKIAFGRKDFDLSKIEKEAGTGHFTLDLINVAAGKVPPLEGFREVSIENPNNVVAWGAMYWQYFEDLDKIKEFKDTPLKLVKQLYKEENSDKGPIIKAVTAETKLQPGDKLKVRIELRVDRNMEYVHMKDTRASGFEPINVLSQYKWQGGLGYYESTRDAATNFFFDYLPKGTYVFEYPLFVNHKGDFSSGITTIQCMYAPEFTSHSEGVRVKVGE
jgi:hypothetical protein